MILVDRSVWIDYFKSGENSSQLDTLINENLILINEVILAELIPILRHKGEIEIIDGLLSLDRVKNNIHWEGIQSLQYLNLKKGINKVGIIDLIIAQQCIEQGLELWSLDKHFSLMAENLELKLFQ